MVDVRVYTKANSNVVSNNVREKDNTMNTAKYKEYEEMVYRQQ